jgi:polar amino acid transport system substrate-binding protein
MFRKEGNLPVKRLILGFLVCCLSLAGITDLAGASDRAPVLAPILERGVLRVGTSGSQPPFSMKARNGELIGYEVDLAKLLAHAMGVKLRLVEKPFPELLPALDSGELDMVMSGMTMTAERNVRFAFVGPYIVSGKSVLSNSASLIASIDVADDINQGDITVTALKGSTSQWFVEKMMSKAKLVTTDDYEAGVQMVLDGKADAMVADMPICSLSVLRFPDAELATLGKPLTLEPIGMALAPGDSLFVNMAENYLGAMKATGLLDQLEKRWFEDASWLVRIPWE